MISSTILNEVIDMHVRASEIKDLSRVMDLINQAKEYFKDNDINQWQKGYPDINTILDDIISVMFFLNIPIRMEQCILL